MIPFKKILAAGWVSVSSRVRGHSVRAPRILGESSWATRDGRSQAQGGSSRDAASSLPPVLLLTPAFYGTLAAARALGRRSVRVTLAGPNPWNVSTFSRYAQTCLSRPDSNDTEELLRWLEEFGRVHERHVLLPTCDDTAWIYARYRERLSKYFYLSSPPIEAIHGLLHKGRLAEHASAVGLLSPRTWTIDCEADLDRVIREAQFPVLVKPATQVLFKSSGKGERVDEPAQLSSVFRRASANVHGRALVEHDPSAARHLVQEFFHNASEQIYNISGYARGGRLLGLRAGRKLLQRPRLLGVGICFEEAEVDPELSGGLERLVQRVGFNGVFEAEFIQTPDGGALLDFNPRFYNQLGFDVARGAPLPELAYQDALEGSELVAPQHAEVLQDVPSGKVFTYGSAFKVLVTTQRLSGALSPERADEWLEWYASKAGNRVDAVEDPDDVWPGRLDLIQMAHGHLRHPRAFLRTIVFNR